MHANGLLQHRLLLAQMHMRDLAEHDKPWQISKGLHVQYRWQSLSQSQRQMLSAPAPHALMSCLCSFHLFQCYCSTRIDMCQLRAPDSADPVDTALLYRVKILKVKAPAGPLSWPWLR